MKMGMISKFVGFPFKLLKYVWNETVEPFQLIVVNHRLRVPKNPSDDVKEIPNNELEAYLKEEGVRAKELDEKLQKVTAATSVAVSIGGLVGQSFVRGLESSPLKVASTSMLLLAMTLLVIGVVIGFDGLRPRPRYGYGPGFLRIKKEGGKKARLELEHAAAASERDNLIRANQTSAATTAIRNGILLYAVAIFIGLVSATFASAPPQNNISTIAPNSQQLPIKPPQEPKKDAAS